MTTCEATHRPAINRIRPQRGMTATQQDQEKMATAGITSAPPAVDRSRRPEILLCNQCEPEGSMRTVDQSPTGRPAEQSAALKSAHTFARRVSAFLTRPFIAGVVLPILTTLLGVYLALGLENRRARNDERDQTVGILSVAEKECDAIQSALSSLKIETEPVFVPTLGISLLNVTQQPSLLRDLKTEDFTGILGNLSGLQEATSRYQRLTADYRATEARPDFTFAPEILPVIGPVPIKTPEEQRADFEKIQADLRAKRLGAMQRLRAALQSALDDYRQRVAGFCEVAVRVKGYLSEE